MQINYRKMLLLCPFSEDEDRFIDGRVLGGYTTLWLGIVFTALLALSSVMLALLGYPDQALDMVAISVAASAITAGIEWHSGLRMRAANQLFASVVLASMVALVVP